VTLLKVAKAKRTCIACPSQWDIWLEDGRQLYARYRFGYFYLAESPLASPILEFEHGDEWQGDMGNEEMMDNTSPLLDWRDAVWDGPIEIEGYG
jgi:hypothetical protein